MSVYLTTTKHGLEYINHQFVKQKGVWVLKMVRPNGQELKEGDLR